MAGNTDHDAVRAPSGTIAAVPASATCPTALNALFTLLDIESWKPLVAALLLPPAPFLFTVLVGARLILPRRGLGWCVVLLSVAGLWLCACTGTGRLLEQYALHVPPALTPDRLKEIQADPAQRAIVVLGGGAESYAPEYGVGNLAAPSLERLRYGLWLSRSTGVPVAFSGGVGWAQGQSAPEADIATRIAADEFGRPLQWHESDSHDTRQNAVHSVTLLKRAGVTRLLLVTHGWHMPRALRAFKAAALPEGVQVEAAPMGLAARTESPALDWLPTQRGFQRVRQALHELLGLLAGS